MAKIERIVPIVDSTSQYPGDGMFDAGDFIVQSPRTNLHTIARSDPNRTEELPSSRYKYNPIDTSVDGIRLLILEPTQNSTTLINCRLIHVTFAQKPKYEALSYTWGDETTRRKISIDGKDLTVAQNLFDALIHLQHPSEERVLWIDAICINQLDFTEKSKQIGKFQHVEASIPLVEYPQARGTLL
jgi:hypothetical protein